jgi:hypothetical protein
MAKILLSIGEDANEHLSTALHAQIASELSRLGHAVSIVKWPAKDDLNKRAKKLSDERKGEPLSIEELEKFMAGHESRKKAFWKKLVKAHPDTLVFSMHDGTLSIPGEFLSDLMDRVRGESTGPMITPGRHFILSLPNLPANHHLVEVASPKGSTHPDAREQIPSFVNAVDPLYLEAEEKEDVFEKLRELYAGKKPDLTRIAPQLNVFSYLLSESNLHAAKHFGLVSAEAAKKIAQGIHEVAVGMKKPLPYQKELRRRG